jgi:hypothetical protein
MVSFIEENDKPTTGGREAMAASAIGEHPDDGVAHAEAVLIGDDKLVKVALKIRDKIAEVTKEFEAQVKVLKDQQTAVTTEIIRRLNERGATQTKTPFGTAFVGEKMTANIADAATFKSFCLEHQDLDFYQARVKIEHLREYMEANEGRLPPGINVFREVTLNLRAKT